jgi:hypothetical protein
MVAHFRGALKAIGHGSIWSSYLIVHGSTWSFYLIVRGSISNSYNNFFMCASGGPHWGTLFLLFLCCVCSCFYCAFVVHALVLVALLLCTCSYYAFITCTHILDMFMLCNCSCCSSVVNALVFVFNCRALIFVALLLRSWPSYITTLSCSLTFDLLVLLPCTAFQIMTLLHCCAMLLLSSWPSCVVVLCCFSVFDPLTLLLCSLVFDLLTLLFSF